MEQIEQRAERVLERVPGWLWDGETLPVPVEDIADSYFNLLVRETDDLSVAPGAPSLAAGQSLSGLLLPSRREIWVNADEGRQWPGRRRFTICHELGHWCMHRDGADDHRGVFCRSTTVEPPPEGEAEPPTPSIEEEAQVFAAAMLMPAHLVRGHYRRNGDFLTLCDRFGTSGAAMGRRLHAVVPRSQ